MFTMLKFFNIVGTQIAIIQSTAKMNCVLLLVIIKEYFNGYEISMHLSKAIRDSVYSVTSLSMTKHRPLTLQKKLPNMKDLVNTEIIAGTNCNPTNVSVMAKADIRVPETDWKAVVLQTTARISELNKKISTTDV